jgi:hypothetical protein
MMMSHEAVTLWSLVGIHLLWVAAPLLPAILIYKLFPSTSVAVNGLLANLTVRATGAFAGYLVVFAATYPIVKLADDTIGSFLKPYWTITAQIILRDKDGRELNSDKLLDTLLVNTRPEPFYTANNYVHMLVPEVQSEVQSLPYLFFQVPHFGRQGFDFRTYKGSITIDQYNKIITINDPIVISAQTEEAATNQ